MRVKHLLLATALSFAALMPATAAEQIPVARIGLSGQIGNLDPTIQQNAPTYQQSVLFGGQLFRFDKDRNLQPDLVESYEMSPDGLTYTMKLRQGLKYSDGTPLTIDDVVYTWNRIKDAAPVNKTLIGTVKDLKATDDHTLVWTLSAPQADFLQFFGLQFMLVHPKAKIESDPDYFTHPVSAGPYMIKDWVPGAPSATLVENPNYWGGPRAVKELETISVPDLTSRTLQLAQGDLDFVFDLAPSVRGVISPDVRTYPHPIAGMYHVVFNLGLPDDAPLKNRDVREAISLAIDRDAVSKKAFFGISAPATSFMFPGTPEQNNNLPNGGKRDIDAAKALLAKTPFANGFDMRLGVWGARPGWKDAVQVIADNLKDLGIKVTIESMEDAVAVQQLNDGKFEAQFSGNASYPPVVFLGNELKSGNSWSNWARYKSDKMDDLFGQIGAAVDTNKRLDLIKQVQDLAYADLPLIPISERVVLSGNRLPDGVLGAIKFGEFLYVAPLAK
jgi:peptide/nickel transport system substrate-binding protein